MVVIALVSAISARASTSAVVGFYNVPVPSGNSAWVCGLVGADLYQGAVATVTADTDGKALVQFASPGWTAGAFTLHYAEPQSGTGVGLVLDILSNTNDTVKLNTTPAAAGLTSGMVFIVRKHATLAGLLPDGGGFVPFSDTISVFGTNGLQTTYFFNSGSQRWITVLGVDSSNVVIRPGQGFVIQMGTAKSVTLGKGEISYVKTTPTKIFATAHVPNLVGALNPLGSSTTTLSALGATSSLQVFSDSIVTLSAGSLAQTGTYLSTGGGLVNSGTGANGDSVSLGAGASVVINVNTAKNVNLAPVPVSP
jgi:hypothetical protein